MTVWRAILVNDERLARSSLRALLSVHPEIEIVAEAANVRQARELIEANRPDVVFLDIQMPGGGGFRLLEQVHDPPAVVFVTGYDEYAVRAFEVNAVDHLLKPVEPHRLAMAIARLHFSGHDPPLPAGPYAADDCVWIKTNRQNFFLPVSRIAAVLAAENYNCVVCEDGHEHLVRRCLKEWEPLLPADGFVALDRSCLVNWQQVTRWRVRGREIELCVGRRITPLQLGRAAAQRFTTEVVPRMGRGTEARAPDRSGSGTDTE